MISDKTILQYVKIMEKWHEIKSIGQYSSIAIKRLIETTKCSRKIIDKAFKWYGLPGFTILKVSQ